jgi:hypothetical protein
MEQTVRKSFSTASTVNCSRTVHDLVTLDKLFLNTCLAVNQRFPDYYICGPAMGTAIASDIYFNLLAPEFF